MQKITPYLPFQHLQNRVDRDSLQDKTEENERECNGGETSGSRALRTHGGALCNTLPTTLVQELTCGPPAGFPKLP
eukprot:c48805_g1_i1 orf=1-225(-)